MDSVGQIVLGAGVTSAFHPLSYVKTLIQIGYEPLEPQTSTSIFGRRVLCYPNAFKYLGHIRKCDGFFGMYSGLGARLTGGIVGSFVTNGISMQIKGVPFEKGSKSSPPPSTSELDGVEEDLRTVLGRLCRDTLYESVARCGGVIASHPFHVIMVRQMAQFVGKETVYSNMFLSVREIYERDGIVGFFAGLIPRLFGEVLTIWLANVLAHILNNYVIPKTQGSSDLKTYTSAVCSLVVTQVTYPFILVSNVMAVNGCGLLASRPPAMLTYEGWTDCWRHLAQENALKRGSSMFWRYYRGPVTFRAGLEMPVARRF